MDKLDKILDNQIEMKTSLAVVEQKLEDKGRRLTNVEKEVKDLNKFKWGVIGTAAVSIQITTTNLVQIHCGLLTIVSLALLKNCVMI